MQRASGDSGVRTFFDLLRPATFTLMPSDPLQFSSYRPQNDDWYRRSNGYSTRRLSTAIDSLRREGEAILWELNSLMTQNLSLEQRCEYHERHVKLLYRSIPEVVYVNTLTLDTHLCSNRADRRIG